MGQAVHSEHRRNLENSRAKPKMWWLVRCVVWGASLGRWLVQCVVWVDIAVASVVCGVWCVEPP